MSKVCIKENQCIGCGACVAIAPSNFDFDDEGLSKVINSDLIDEDTKNAEAACPVSAIEIND